MLANGLSVYAIGPIGISNNSKINGVHDAFGSFFYSVNKIQVYEP